MTEIELICDLDRRRLLGDWDGTPAQKLEEVVSARGLRIRFADLGRDREGALDLDSCTIFVNSKLHELCDPRTDLWGARNSIVAHELGHVQLHRSLLWSGAELGWREEEEAYVYAETFLLPRHMLRDRIEVHRLCSMRKRGSWRRADLWRCVDGLASAFEVTRSAVVHRLVGLGLVVRDGKSISLSPYSTPKVDERRKSI